MKHKILAIIIFWVFHNTCLRGQKVWTLTDCISYGRTHSQRALELGILKENFYEMQKQTSSGYAPIVSGIYNAGLSNTSATTYSYLNQFGFQISQDLTSIIKISHQKKQLNFRIAQNDENISFAQNAVEEATLRAYIQALTTKEQLGIFRNYKEKTERLMIEKLPDIKSFLDALAQQDALNIAEASRAYETTLLQIRQIINLDSVTNFEIAPLQIYDNLKSEVDEVLKKAISIDPFINNIKYGILIAGRDIQLAMQDNWPRINLLYQTFYLKENNTSGIQHFFGLNINIPILNKRDIKTRIRIAKINERFQKKRLSNALQNLEDAIQLNLEQLKNAKIVYAESIKSAKRNKAEYENACQQFVSKKLQSGEFLAIRNQAIQEELRMVNAKYTVILNAKLLDFSIGTTL